MGNANTENNITEGSPGTNTCTACGKVHNVGFISTRLAGTDGVSLETVKWAEALDGLGFNNFYFAGELDTPADCSYLSALAHFKHTDIRDIYHNTFGVRVRPRGITRKIYKLKQALKDDLHHFIEKFDIDLLIPQNALTIPLNIPLGIAITEVIAETGMPTIAHHHDFFWERQHFTTNAVWEFLNMAFPPHLPFIKHVVINSSADNQLSLRTGISATIIPNVMDFDNPPGNQSLDKACRPGRQIADSYAADVRRDLGIGPDELLVLQPTRVVKRKGIEHAIELVHRLGRRAKLVISHASGDEGYDYQNRVINYSKLMGVDTLFVSDIIADKRGTTPSGGKVYTLYDIYPHADLITYPSNIEGFGNAFLEAVYFCKPIVVNTYAIYALDIKPKGFSVIELDGYVSEETVERTRQVLDDPVLLSKMVAHNYDLARNSFSYGILTQKLSGLLTDLLGCRF